MTPFPIPEILRIPLESLVLQAKIHSPSLKVLRESSDDCVFFFCLHPILYSMFLIYSVMAFVILCVCVWRLWISYPKFWTVQSWKLSETLSKTYKILVSHSQLFMGGMAYSHMSEFVS